MSSPYINRFLQPDTIIPYPANPQSWNRYSYVRNNPVNFNDPTGHMETGPCGAHGEDCGGGPTPPATPPVTSQGNPANTLDEKLSSPEPLVTIGPNTDRVPVCSAQVSQGMSTADILQGIRIFCGKFDPTLVNPELGGTTLNYSQMVAQSSLYLANTYGLDPMIATKAASVLPVACFAYNCVYDPATNTGDHRDLRDISISPRNAAFTIATVTVAVPTVVEVSPTLIAALVAFFSIFP